MSTTIETTTDDVELPETHETSKELSHKFNVTEENRTCGITVSLGIPLEMRLEVEITKSPQFRSKSQFLNDAMTYYLDVEDTDESAVEIVEGTEWDTDGQMTGVLTPTLFHEIEFLVNHPHTVWETKQEFFICAIATYTRADMPTVIRR